MPFYHPPVAYDQCANATPPCPPGVAIPLSHGAIDEPWETFDDSKSALTAVEWIKNASLYEEPFFLAVGFHRPHIPCVETRRVLLQTVICWFCRDVSLFLFWGEKRERAFLQKRAAAECRAQQARLA